MRTQRTLANSSVRSVSMPLIFTRAVPCPMQPAASAIRRVRGDLNEGSGTSPHAYRAHVAGDEGENELGCASRSMAPTRRRSARASLRWWEEEREAFSGADVLIGNRFDASLPRPERLRLFHLPAAGYDAVNFALLPRGT